jgi:LPXTG-motif cell wall-anchored protein
LCNGPEVVTLAITPRDIPAYTRHRRGIMSHLAPAIATVALTAGLVGAPAAAAFAATTPTTCDAYSQTCPTVKGEHFQKPPAVQGSHIPSSQLPFTGADVAAFSLAGAAAIGGGAAFVVVGRRRRRTFA